MKKIYFVGGSPCAGKSTVCEIIAKKYCVIYTIATLVNSVLYLINGTYSDPNGNWHEIDRALIVLIGVLAYKMATKLPIKNTLVRMIVTYIPTMSLTFFYIWLTGFREPLASSAYQDIFINYTGLFLIISVIAIVLEKGKSKKLKGR